MDMDMDIEEIKSLWKEAFGDSDEYLDFYFTQRFNPENARVIYENGRVVSMAHVYPYDIKTGGDIAKGVYILGVATRVEHRGRGLATKLLNEIIEEQAASGVDMVFLIPANTPLFDFYGIMGFEDFFYAYEETVNDIADGNLYEITEPPFDDIYHFYDNFYRSLTSAALKTREDFRFAVDEVIMSGDKIAVCRDGIGICGFAAYEPGTIKELLCADETARRTLVNHFKKPGENLSVISPTPFAGAVKKAIGMAKWLKPCQSQIKESYANLLMN